MRRRDRFSNIAWLGRFLADERGQHNARPYVGQPPPLQDGIKLLLAWGYLVQFETDGTAYAVRLLPIRERLPLRLPPIGLSYIGSDLRNVLAAAVQEAQTLMNGQETWELSIKEVQRWVR